MMSGHVRVRAAGLLAGVGLFATTACGSGTAANSITTAPGGQPSVVTAFYPLQWLSEKVGGPDIKVSVLTAPGVEPHDLELGAQQMADLEDATLAVYIKGVQPAVDEALEQRSDQAFDAATAVKTIPLGEHAEEDGHDHEHAVSYDPHLWLDPSRLATVAGKLAERLAQADPEHAQAYRDRAAKTAAELTALDQEMTKGLTSCTSKTMVTSHEAFGYLADRYKLKQIGITLDPESEPSPARIAEVAKLANSEKVTTIFTEALVSPKVAEVLAQEVGAKTAVLDPLESKPGTGDYLTQMRHNLKTLQIALGCA
ncbi:metal ABC transporter substrate-binding protein [Nonomuraea typhae]|uniref:metal ABC transporter substrate-binding protein n=1 Tax=Nonomuraea typhae TaxID=2603600 RepID=UPI0012F8E845|nr:metal ABC transporter substrate-binding protein [Nonomuraea typhae]